MHRIVICFDIYLFNLVTWIYHRIHYNPTESSTCNIPFFLYKYFYFHTSTIRYFLLSSIKLIRKEHRIVKYTPRAHNLFATKTGTSVINTSKKLSFIIRECKRQITTKGILFYLLYRIANITIYYESFPIIELFKVFRL